MRASAPFAARRKAPFIKWPKLQATPPAGLFDHLAPRYDLINLIISGGFVMYWDHKLKQALTQGAGGQLRGAGLDLACGTLRFMRGLTRLAPQARLLGVDLSRPMLRAGLKRFAAPASGPGDMPAMQATATALPLPDNSLDFVVSQFAWRNLPARPQVLAEILRVLKPGGRLAVMDFGSGKQRIWGGTYNFYLRRVLPWLGGALSSQQGDYAYLAQSILDFPLPESICAEMRAAGLTRVSCRALTSGIVIIYEGYKG